MNKSSLSLVLSLYHRNSHTAPEIAVLYASFSAGILTWTRASVAGCMQYRLALGNHTDGREHGQMTLQTARALPEQVTVKKVEIG